MATAVRLDALARQHSPLPVDRALDILRGLARHLDVLREFGDMHGALTPAQVLVADDGGVQLLPPQPLRAVVADAYAAPELRHADAAVDARADQYALAVIAWELLSGQSRVVHDDVTGVEVINSIDVSPGRVLRPGLSHHVGAVLHDALNRDPQWRYESAGAFVDALATAVTGRPAPSSLRTPDDPPPAAPRPKRPRQRRAHNPSAGNLLINATLLLAAVAIIAGAALYAGGASFGFLDRWWSRRPQRQTSLGAFGEPAGTTGNTPALPPGTRPSSAVTLGYVRVTVTGGSPQVLIDGDVVGSGSRVFAVATGAHRVSVNGAGRRYSPAVALVAVTANDTSTATFAAEP